MKYLYTLVAIFISISTITAQDSRWGFGVELGLGSYSLASAQGDLIKSSEKFGMQADLLASYWVSDRVLLSAGVGSIKLNYEITDYTFSFACDHDGTGGYDPYNSYLTVRDELVGLTIPVLVSVYFGQKENRFYTKPGITYVNFVQPKNRYQLYECSQPTATIDSDFYSVSSSQWQTELNIGYEFGYDFPFKFMKRLQYRIEFGAKYFLSQAFDLDGNAHSFWSWGGTVGVRYDLAANIQDNK